MTSPYEPPEPPFGDPRIVDGGGYLYMDGEILVHTDDQAVLADALEAEQARLISADTDLDSIVALYRLPAGTDTPGVVDLLRARYPDAAVELNHVWTAQTYPFAGAPRYHGDPVDAPLPAGVMPIPQQVNANTVLVAVLDTGLARSAYAQLAGRLHQNTAEYDDIYLGGKPPAIALMGGHGTMVAGLVAVRAPNARIMALQVLKPAGNGTEQSVMAGIVKAVQAGANVINMSLGGYVQPGGVPVLDKFLTSSVPATTAVVAAAGNDGSSNPFYPACHPRVVGVGAAYLDSTGQVAAAPFSNTGPWVRACAPGVRTQSTYVKGTWMHGGTTGPIGFAGYAMWSGTSFATPHVAAAFARRAAQGGSARDAEVALLTGPGPTLPGYGRVLWPPY